MHRILKCLNRTSKVQDSSPLWTDYVLPFAYYTPTCLKLSVYALRGGPHSWIWGMIRTPCNLTPLHKGDSLYLELGFDSSARVST